MPGVPYLLYRKEFMKMSDNNNNAKTMYEAVPAAAELNKVPGFDPLKFLRRAGDSMKLDLPYQKLWFRMAHPNGRMRLTAMRITEQMAIFEAKVFLDRSDAEPFSVSVAQQTMQDSRDFVKAAQNEALSQALSDAGFGIQLVSADTHAASVQKAAPVSKTDATTDADEEKRRAEHEAAEAKRKAEWEARQAEKKKAEQEQLERLAAMSDDEVVNASMQRVNADTEKLTRRNMKECVAEFIQTKCLEDIAFARLTMHPRKSMIHCFQYISRKAWDYIQDELKASGIQPGPGSQGYGCDVPDDLCYQWAEDYFRDPDAKEDHKEEEKFVPNPYYGKDFARTTKKKQKEKKKAEAKPKPVQKEKPANDGQLSLLDLGMTKAG